MTDPTKKHPTQHDFQAPTISRIFYHCPPLHAFWAMVDKARIGWAEHITSIYPLPSEATTQQHHGGLR